MYDDDDDFNAVCSMISIRGPAFFFVNLTYFTGDFRSSNILAKAVDTLPQRKTYNTEQFPTVRRLCVCATLLTKNPVQMDCESDGVPSCTAMIRRCCTLPPLTTRPPNRG